MTEKKKNLILQVYNLPIKFIKPKVKSIVVDITEKFLSSKKFPCKIIINFIQPEVMLQLNKTYKNRDYETDILTFPYYEWIFEKDEKVYFLGEIFLNMEKIKENAIKEGNKITYELLFIIAHGILHLMGFTHENEKKLKEMLQLQDKFVKKVM